ncbi:MAG: PIN domain-containing protein [archaeon]|nr:PIN domain-containing protein [archaeon]
MTVRKKSVYDTRFFAALYYSKTRDEIDSIKQELAARHAKFISTITIYEVFKLTLQTDGREVADLRIVLLRKDFKAMAVTEMVAREAALIWHKYRVPMADAIIAATAKSLKADCVTNDPHLTSMKEIKTRWI